MQLTEFIKIEEKEADMNTTSQKEVTIYKGDELLIKVESGTTLKVLKLLCESQGVSKELVLGVKPDHGSDQISCISTLDDTALLERSYQLVLTEKEIKKTVECMSCTYTKGKEYRSVGVNTNQQIVPRDINNNGKHAERIIPSPPMGRLDYRREANYYDTKSIDAMRYLRSPSRNELNENYRSLQETTQKLYARRPGIESISHHGYKQTPSSIMDSILYEKSRAKYPPGQYDEIFSRSFSPPTENGAKRLKYTEETIVNRLKRESPLDEMELRIRQSKMTKSSEESLESYKKTRALKESLPRFVKSNTPPALLRYEDQQRFEKSKGEEPPVYVLPNDFDMLNNDGISKYERKEALSVTTDYSPVPYTPPKFSPSQYSPDKLSTNLQQFSPSNGKVSSEDEMLKSNGSIKKSKSPTNSPRNSPDSSTNVEGKLRCKICNEIFATKSLLYKHLRGHTSDEKPFKCSECGQGFTLSSNLRQHRIIHRGYKPFQCEFCGKKFMRSNVYKQHRRIHTGEEMHKCTLCPSEFLQKYALIKHMKKNHNIDATDM